MAFLVRQVDSVGGQIVITEEQIAYFQTFGFLVLRQAFQPDEMDAITQKFDELLDKERGGQPFPGESRQSLYGIAESHPFADGFGGG